MASSTASNDGSIGPSASAEDVERLRALFASGQLVHPYLSSEHFSRGRHSEAEAADVGVGDDVGLFIKSDVQDNFVDLAASLSICCGATPPPADNNSALSEDDCSFLQNNSDVVDEGVDQEVQRRRLQLASEIGGGTPLLMSDGADADGNKENTTIYKRRHIILILCDGMGNSILQNTVNNEDTHRSTSDTDTTSFFVRNNQPSRLRAVFPSTTPAALTTLATATWPGRHGMPGWNLRDKKGCDFPGNEQNPTTYPPVQLLVLSDHIRDDRTGKLASEMGFESWDEVFVEKPWARQISDSEKKSSEQQQQQKQEQPENNNSRRKMIYVNAYNGDDYQNWSQGGDNNDESKGKEHTEATDFSSWFIGDNNDNAQEGHKRRNNNNNNTFRHYSTLFETAKIEETAFETLGTPEGSNKAISYFRQGINAALRSIAKAERSGDSTFIYLYTAHPDKHMHSLGVEHEEVRKVVRGIENEVERFWNVLGDREVLLSGQYNDDDDVECKSRESASKDSDSKAVDAAVVVTADHGHITVGENDMIELPKNILDLLEYACIGVHGKGRHGYLYCRAGLQPQLRRRWKANADLSQNFLLLTIEEAVKSGLFGPHSMRLEVRPRLGDFVAISVGKKTLVTPSEVENFRNPCRCQGAHGSLLAEEMCIPFILLSPDGGE